MTTGTKLLLIGGVLAGTAYAYRQGVNNIDFEVDGYQFAPNGTDLLMRIKATNRNAFFGYPVPPLSVNVFDSGQNFVGTIVNHQLQYIPANSVSFIYGVITPNFASLITIILSMITTGTMPEGLVFDGAVKVGPIYIPFNTVLNRPAVGGVKEVFQLMSACANVLA